jgi:uncharacterized delta-60 repeat protein
MKKITLLYLLLLGIQLQSQILDSSFGTNGIVTNQFSTTPVGDTATGGVLQSDGKIVLVTSNKVLRINIDGTLDNSFNNYGNLTISNNKLESIIIQNDGKIIVAGLNSVYRINADGTVDTNFGSNGKVIIQINNYDMHIKSIGLRSNGKIVLGGYVSNGTNNDFAISCLNIDGSFDTIFDTDGKVTLDINNLNNEGNELAIQNDDKIIITGQAIFGNYSNFTTARYNIDGTLDSNFGTNGFVNTLFGSYGCQAKSIDIDVNGNIVVSGISSYLAIVRYTPLGVLDTTFNSTGILITNKSNSISTLTSTQSKKPHLKCLSNGKILISTTGSNYEYNLHQINNDGSFDSTFGVNGTATYNATTSNNSSYLLIKPDGKIITGGTSYSSSIIKRIEKLQFSSDGIFESEQYYNTVLSVDSIIDMIEQSSGKTIACGGTDYYDKYTLVRYNIDGSIDSTFGINGILTTTSPFFALAKQPDDKLLINDTSLGQSITRYTSDGVLDATFGVGGVVDYSAITPVIISFIDAITVSQNGKINVAFDYSTTGIQCGQTHFGALRLNADGTLDTSFGINGYSDIAFDFYSTDESEFPQSIYEDTDGKLVITGIIENTANTIGQVGTARLNSDGTIDTSFGTNGKVVTQLGVFEIGRSILKTPNNKYLINSYDLNASPSFTSLVQYNYDGSIDTTFGINGILSNQQHSFSVILQPDGKILRGGTTNSQFAIYRNNADGSLDTTFGTNGLLSTPIFYLSNINKLLYLQNGKILAGGYSFNGTNQVFAQARYTFENLGTSSNTHDNSFKTYPNPANNQFTIDFGNEIKPINYHVKIINLLGQEVHNSFEKNIVTIIPVTWNGKGLYFVNIYDEQNNLIKTEKIIIE